jgi:hypothetical protein
MGAFPLGKNACVHSSTDLKVFIAYNHNFHVPQKTETLQTFNLEETHLVHATLVLYT